MKAKTVGPAFIVRKSDHPIEKSQVFKSIIHIIITNIIIIIIITK